MGYRISLLSKHLICWAVTGLLMISLAQAQDLALEFIGQQIIPHNHQYKDTIVGGLSALEYDVRTGRYIAICDDRSDTGPARFYGLKLGYDASGFHSWQLTDVHTMKRPDGSVFPAPSFMGASSVDPEALKLSPAHSSYLWTSEGHAKKGVNPFVREMKLDGTYIRDFAVPEKYHIGEGTGIRDNLAFEALTVTTDQKSILLSIEGPLIQDGAEADAEQGADVRLLQMDIDSGQPVHEYVYTVEPVHKETLPFGNFSINGVVDILALDRDQYIVVERSFSTGAGLSVKLYLADLSAATDVLGLHSLKGATYQTAQKTLLLDLGELGIPIDNIEGMTFGRTLKDGRRTLVLISDNNFRSAQISQILVFAVDGLAEKLTSKTPH
ncbi:MAG: PEP-CTERM sorting domain-containing protein [Alphaproteobacteria bacterium]|nr:MAG: PEP-CTERM sorting domain-containing protein [Alphaproteobacteria bacterium]